jgi:hypothetical protein
MDYTSEKLDVVINHTKQLVSWWERVDRSLGMVERKTKNLHRGNVQNQAMKIRQAEEVMARLAEQFLDHSIRVGVIHKTCDTTKTYPPH